MDVQEKVQMLQHLIDKRTISHEEATTHALAYYGEFAGEVIIRLDNRWAKAA